MRASPSRTIGGNGRSESRIASVLEEWANCRATRLNCIDSAAAVTQSSAVAAIPLQAQRTPGHPTLTFVCRTVSESVGDTRSKRIHRLKAIAVHAGQV